MYYGLQHKRHMRCWKISGYHPVRRGYPGEPQVHPRTAKIYAKLPSKSSSFSQRLISPDIHWYNYYDESNVN
jgi:hypothetical protein